MLSAREFFQMKNDVKKFSSILPCFVQLFKRMFWISSQYYMAKSFMILIPSLISAIRTAVCHRTIRTNNLKDLISIVTFSMG